jgi:hypothetical protein
MGSKYERLFRGLARTLGTEPKFQDLVNQKKAEIPDGLSPTELATLYRQISDEKDEAAAKAAEIQVRLAAVEQRMWSAFDEAGIDNIGFADGYRVAVTQKTSVKTEDRDKVIAWMKTNGFERLLSVHAQTLSTLTLERLLEELPPPDGVSVTLYPKTSLTKQ